MWFRWIIDVGTPGPDRGQGGTNLILPPGYNGPVPEGGYFTVHARTNVVMFGRAFLENDNPSPVAQRIRKIYRAYPYVPGSYGTSVASFLNGKTPLGPLTEPQPPKFVEGSGETLVSHGFC
jgi:Protein of unknown function (DUF1254)